MRIIRAAAVAVSGLGIALATPALARPMPKAAPAALAARSSSQWYLKRHHQTWSWPLGPGRPRVVRGFELPANRWDQGHRGVDLLGAVGQDVHAAGEGTVSFAGVLFGRPVVAVDHAAPGRDTLRTTYEPVDPTVRVGDRVKTGAVVGHLAADATDPSVGHCAPLACLHWGLVRGFGHSAHYLDPTGLLAQGRVRLLPIWER